MACLIKRKNNLITDVRLPDGKIVSTAYYDILSGIETKGLPAEHGGNINASLQKHVGKYIKNTTDPSEQALGIYLTLYTPKFQSWYGQWVEEPKINADYTITKDGLTRSIFDFIEFTHPLDVKLSSRRVKSIKGLLPTVKLMRDELKDRIKQHVDARERAKLNKEYSKEQKIEREKYYNALIKRLETQIDTLQKENSIKIVVAQGLADIQTIKEMLSGSVVSLSELLLADDIIKTWTNMERLFNIPNIMEVPADSDGTFTTRDTLIEINDAAQSFNNRIAYFAKNEILKAINKNVGEGQEVTIKDIEAMKDVSYWKAKARDITTVDNKLVGYLAKLITEVNMRIEKEHNRNHKKIDEATAKIMDNPLFKENGFDLFIKQQETKNPFGEPIKTLGFKGRFSQEWYESIKRRYRQLKENLDTAKDNKEVVAAVWAEHNQWVKEHTIAFNSAPFINTSAFTDEQRLNVINDLKNQGFTAEEINDFVKQARARYSQYVTDAETFSISLQDDIIKGVVVLQPEDGTDEEYIEKQVEEWKKINDPLAYNALINGTLKFDRSTVTKGSKYSIKIPRKIVNGANSNYYDQDFAKIAADKDLYEFYVFFRDFMKQQLSYLPQDEIDSLQSNFLPVVTERLSKEYGLSGLKEGMKGIDEWFFKNLTTIDYKTAGKADPISGVTRYGFTPRFINENVPVEQRSTDLNLIAKLFSDMALIYKHKIEVQDTIDTINNIVQGATSSTKNVRLKGDVVVSEAPKVLQEMVQSTVLRSFYRITPEAEGVMDRPFYNSLELLTLGTYKSEKYKQAKALEKELEALSQELENNRSLTTAERKSIERQITEKTDAYYELGGRNLSISSFFDAFNKFTREKGIALNPFSAVRNLAVGGVNNQIHAYGKEDFDSAQLRKATSILKTSVAKYISWGTVESEQSEKILRMMLDTKTIEGEDNTFAHAIKGLNGRSMLDTIKSAIPSPFGLMKSTDYFFRSQTAIAMLLNTKVKTTKGEFNLFEIMDKDLNIDTEKFGEWDMEANGGKTFDEVYDKSMMKINQISKKLHGFSGDVQSLAGKDNIIGRILFVFRSWLPETLATRFETKRHDPILERDTEGYYKTFFGNFINDDGLRIKESISEIIDAITKGEVEGLDKMQVANIRKMMMELAAIVVLAATYLALKLAIGGDDEDDEDKKYANILLNQLTLLNRDLTYYINPFSFSELLQNAVPITATLNQTRDAIVATTYYLARVEKTDEEGTLEYDGERTLLKISKSLPWVNNVNRVIYYSGRMGNVR
jgi:hypothetical protein